MNPQEIATSVMKRMDTFSEQQMERLAWSFKTLNYDNARYLVKVRLGSRISLKTTHLAPNYTLSRSQPSHLAPNLATPHKLTSNLEILAGKPTIGACVVLK